MKKEICSTCILFAMFLLIPVFLPARQQEISIPIPMKGGIVFYEKTYKFPERINEQKALVLGKTWIKKTFPDGYSTTLTARDTRSISCAGTFKIFVSASGNYFWIKMKIVIAFRDSGYTCQLFDYYEKPIEKGISNEYSKIEYRWWDYRQGKPWSPEDKPLFEGIHQQSLQLLDSLETAIQ